MTHETHQHVKLSLFVHKFGYGYDIQCYSCYINVSPRNLLFKSEKCTNKFIEMDSDC